MVIPVFNEVQTIGRVHVAVSAALPPVEKQIVDWRDGLKALFYLVKFRTRPIRWARWAARA